MSRPPIWYPNGEWRGKTALLLGDGLALNEHTSLAAWECARAWDYRVLAINHAIRYCTDWADAVIAVDLDPTVWDLVPLSFAGLKIIGVPGETGHSDLLYTGINYETVSTGEGRIDLRNSTLLALRITAQLGAKRILLLGIDPDAYEALRVRQSRFGFIQGYRQVLADLAAVGVTVEQLFEQETL